MLKAFGWFIYYVILYVILYSPLSYLCDKISGNLNRSLKEEYKANLSDQNLWDVWVYCALFFTLIKILIEIYLE